MKALYAIINPLGNVSPVLELLDKWDLVSREMLLGSAFLFLDINLSHLPLPLFSPWQSQIGIKQEKRETEGKVFYCNMILCCYHKRRFELAHSNKEGNIYKALVLWNYQEYLIFMERNVL